MKYNQRQAPLPKESKLNPKVHPIWRGVGFALMIMAPIMAYATTELFLEANATSNWLTFPADLIVKWQDPLILVKVLMTLLLTLVFLIVLQFVYFIIMRLVAPPRYGPMDVPPVVYKGKPYKR
jgi:hypothetical protein